MRFKWARIFIKFAHPFGICVKVVRQYLFWPLSHSHNVFSIHMVARSVNASAQNTAWKTTRYEAKKKMWRANHRLCGLRDVVPAHTYGIERTHTNVGLARIRHISYSCGGCRSWVNKRIVKWKRTTEYTMAVAASSCVTHTTNARYAIHLNKTGAAQPYVHNCKWDSQPITSSFL